MLQYTPGGAFKGGGYRCAAHVRKTGGTSVDIQSMDHGDSWSSDFVLARPPFTQEHLYMQESCACFLDLTTHPQSGAVSFMHMVSVPIDEVYLWCESA